MLKKVSIIVITYNARGDLEECLHSLVKQDYDNFEIIVVNDGSTDGTDEFLENLFSQTSIKMLYFNNKKNLGVAGARNVGINHSTGEIIAFIDADCIADRRWVSEMVKVFNEDIVAVGGKILDHCIKNVWELTEKGHGYIASSEGYVPFIKGCNMSFNSKVLNKFMFNTELKYGYEELLLCQHLRDHGYKIYYQPRALVHHKRRSSLSALFKKKYLEGVSSVWYLKKLNKFFMYKRHFILLIALFLAGLIFVNKLFLTFSILLFMVFSFALLREEIIFKAKSIKEILITLPILILVELSHFWGAVIGLVKFHILNQKVVE